MKEKIKNTKGITLVALIITIIVLLILAVVAITSINNNKIIEYAKNGRDAYTQSKNNETEILSNYENYLHENEPNNNEEKDEEINFYKTFIFNDDCYLFTKEKMYRFFLIDGEPVDKDKTYSMYSVKNKEEYKQYLETYNNSIVYETKKVKIDEIKKVILAYNNVIGVIGKNTDGKLYFGKFGYDDEELDKRGVFCYYESEKTIEQSFFLDSIIEEDTDT